MDTQALSTAIFTGFNADRAGKNFQVLVSLWNGCECVVPQLLPEVPASNQPACRADWVPPESLIELVSTSSTVSSQQPPTVKSSFQLLPARSWFTHLASQLLCCQLRDWFPNQQALGLIGIGIPAAHETRGHSIWTCRHSHWLFPLRTKWAPRSQLLSDRLETVYGTFWVSQLLLKGKGAFQWACSGSWRGWQLVVLLEPKEAYRHFPSFWDTDLSWHILNYWKSLRT